MSLEVSCSFRRDRFSLEVGLVVGAGDMVALTGSNGAGKTTLLNLVAGLLPVESGSITIDGEVVDSAGDPGPSVFTQPERRRVGLLPQGGALFPHLTALENVAFGPRATGTRPGAARSLAADLLARFGIADLAARRPHELSGGQRQRVAVARTLAVSPRVLLLDEPMSSLDEDGRADVRAALGDLRAGFGGPVLIVSHDPRDTAGLVDRHLEISSESTDGTRVSRLGSATG